MVPPYPLESTAVVDQALGGSTSPRQLLHIINKRKKLPDSREKGRAIFRKAMAAAREAIHGETPSLVQVADYIVGSFPVKSERHDDNDGMPSC